MEKRRLNPTPSGPEKNLKKNVNAGACPGIWHCAEYTRTPQPTLKNNMKNNISALKTLYTTGLACAALQGSVSAATLINMDFNRLRNGAGGGTMTGAAVLGASGDVWNSTLTDTGTLLSLALQTSANAASGITLTSTATDSGWTHGQSTPPRTLDATSAAQTLRYDWLRAANAATTTLTLSNLTVGHTYELILYGGMTGGNYTVGADTRTIQGWGFTATGNVIDTTLTVNQDYTIYTGTIGAGGNLAFTVTDITTSQAGDTANDGLAGFQLSVVPEPSTALLGAVGMIALLRRRRA